VADHPPEPAAVQSAAAPQQRSRSRPDSAEATLMHDSPGPVGLLACRAIAVLHLAADRDRLLELTALAANRRARADRRTRRRGRRRRHWRGHGRRGHRRRHLGRHRNCGRRRCRCRTGWRRSGRRKRHRRRCGIGILPWRGGGRGAARRTRLLRYLSCGLLRHDRHGASQCHSECEEQRWRHFQDGHHRRLPNRGVGCGSRDAAAANRHSLYATFGPSVLRRWKKSAAALWLALAKGAVYCAGVKN
jgi:hypothetical protein